MVTVELPFIPKVIDFMHQVIKTYLEREHSILLFVTCTLYVYQVCYGAGRCVKDGSCSSSSLEWKLTDSINGISYYLNKCQTLSNTSHITLHMHCACNTVQLLRCSELSTSFLLNHAPNSLELNALITRFREPYSSVSMSRESKRLKKSRRDWLNSGNALIQHLNEKMRFSCSPYCRVVHKLFRVAQ